MAYIDADLLKSEACKCKETGRASEIFGALLMEIASSEAGRFYRSRPADRDDAASGAVLKCLVAVASVNCKASGMEVLCYLKTVSINHLRDCYGNDRRARERLAELAESQTPDRRRGASG